MKYRNKEGRILKAGVSTACLYPRLLEESLYDLAVNGVDCVEIFINTDCELSKRFIGEMKSTLDRFEVSVASLHPYTCGLEPIMFFSPYERRVGDMLDYYKRYFEAMQQLNAQYFVLHGCKGFRLDNNEFYFERFKRIVEAGKEFGITVCQENVHLYVSGNLKFLKEMSNALGDDAAFVLDTKQCVRCGENPFDYVKAIGNKVKHVHLSDSSEKGDCLLMGRGRFDYRRFLAQLKEKGFDGAVMLELYRSNFNSISDLISSYNIIENAISRIDGR